MSTAASPPDRPGSEALSVVIPVYGPGPHLERVVEALRHQTLPIARIIISHSGAEDPTRRFADAQNVRVVHSPERLFAGAARNRGLECVETEWVSFIDEDIVVDPDWHANLRAAIQAGNADCFVGAIEYAESGGYWGLSQWIIEFSALHAYMPARPVHGGASANMTVKVAEFRDLGGFPEALRMGEDTYSQSRWRENGHSIRFDPRVVGRHVNIPGFRRMVRHNLTLGIHSARIRRLCPDLPGSGMARWPVLSPALWLVRLILVFGRVFANRGPVILFAIHAPGIIVGLIAHNVGFCRELLRPAPLAIETQGSSGKIV